MRVPGSVSHLWGSAIGKAQKGKNKKWLSLSPVDHNRREKQGFGWLDLFFEGPFPKEGNLANLLHFGRASGGVYNLLSLCILRNTRKGESLVGLSWDVVNPLTCPPPLAGQPPQFFGLNVLQTLLTNEHHQLLNSIGTSQGGGGGKTCRAI